MRRQDREIKQLAVDKPIVNSPYEEPMRYWLYEDHQPKLIEGMRRQAGYYFRPRTRGPKGQMSLIEDEQFVPLELVNDLRHEVKQWREKGYPGASPVTQQLLHHWWREDREPRLFFCQLEAAETMIWLAEINGRTGRRIRVPVDMVEDAEGLRRGYKPLKRHACKMATGSGKTIVMAMIAAWSILNKVQDKGNPRYSDAILIVCPGLTIRERLQVLLPGSEGNYYDKFDLIPPGMNEMLGSGRFHITNWHDFMLRDDSKKTGVLQRGAESDAAFTKRVLHNLGAAKNILVFNDEAHHAYRPPAVTDEETLAALTSDELAEREEATIWVQGLDRINATRGINFCLDLSATPFYIGGSNRDEGTPFPWVVSDFGLVDAIESGLVKIPRVPVDDNTGRSIPTYFQLWRWINDKLKADDPGSAGTGRRKPKPEAILREADGALKQLAGLWKESFEQFRAEGQKVPPALIVVADNTQLSEVFFEHISGESTIEVLEERPGKDPIKRKQTVYGQGQVFPELLSNTESYQPTMRIDSRLIEQAEAGDGDGGRTAAGDALRHRVSTVGKQGEPGEQVRCVVSVAMLTEGWDANNVKQILGLRAFDSQLLCEQVVGRGLRRMNYTVNPDTGLLEEEYVDVYGVPFEVIPVKRRKQTSTATEEKPKTLVQAVVGREKLAIEFPFVEGYVYDVGERITADLRGVPVVEIDPKTEPTEVISRPKAWSEGGAPGLAGPGETVKQTRGEFYRETRLQTIIFDIASRVTMGLVTGAGEEAFTHKAAHQLFPQVTAIVKQFVRDHREGGCILYRGANNKEIGVERYRALIVERLLACITPADASGQARLLPRVERFRRKGSTADVIFSTVRPCRDTLKSHVSHVVLDSEVWEGSAAFELEASEHVVAYVKNDHLGFAVPYTFENSPHSYFPDYLIRLTNGVILIIEIKGQETEQDRQKHAAAGRWVTAVNNAGRWGRWAFDVCKDTALLPEMLEAWVEG